ncbi:MAG: hypothetical protein JSV43_01965 [Methanobacteriota archaeon]|nr:MAG: hypothetical protein JSV43_01965 [Euryarchaeota archaeon]
MRKDVVWAGVIVVYLGAALVVIGGVLNFFAYEKVISRDIDETTEGLNDARKAELFISMGLFVALLGIAFGIAGLTFEKPVEEVKEPVQLEFQPAYEQQPEFPEQQPPQQYPPQP